MKTKVLFAFGDHGDLERNERADRKFFRGAVVPFLEEMTSLGRKVVVIKEGTFVWRERFLSLSRQFGDEEGVLRLDNAVLTNQKASLELFTMAEESAFTLNFLFDQTLNAGMPFRKVNLKELIRAFMNEEKSEFFKDFDEERIREVLLFHLRECYKNPWGFESSIVQINKHKNPSVIVKIEPQDHLAITRLWTHDRLRYEIQKPSLKSGAVNDALKDLAFAFVEGHFVRDLAVLELMDEIAKAEPDTAFVIPRGFLHSNMAHMLKHSKYEIYFRSSSPGQLNSDPFYFKALSLMHISENEEIVRRFISDWIDSNKPLLV